jgi:hypothetical protein
MSTRSKLTVVVTAVACMCGHAFAQAPGNRADYGPKDSRIVGPSAPGEPNHNTAKGAYNPGGLAKGPQDIPDEPATGAGLPGSMGKAKPPSESAGKAGSTGLHGRPR